MTCRLQSHQSLPLINYLESVGDAIGCPPRDVSDRQYELAEELGIDVSDCKSSWVAFVRIREAIQLVNLAAVRRMDLKPGDRVVQTVDPVEQGLRESLGDRWESVAGQFPREFEVSSIREDGRCSSRVAVVVKRQPAIWTRSPHRTNRWDWASAS